MTRRVVITGMGLITSLGNDLPSIWPRLLRGDNGIDRVSFFDASGYPCQVAAEVKSLPPCLAGSDQSGGGGHSSAVGSYSRRGVQLFSRVVQEAYTDACLHSANMQRTDIGVAAGVSVNYINMGLLEYYYRFKKADENTLDMQRFAQEGIQPESAFYRRLGDMTSALAAKELDLAGPNFSIDAACAASLFSIGEAFRLVRRGRVRCMIAGGAFAAVNPLSFLAFGLIGALSRNSDPEQASRPFDQRRDGFVMGEGAGAVVLEDFESAKARGATIYGELAGFGTTMNSHNLTDPSPDGECEERAMRFALEDAGMSVQEVDYVAAHGTSTPKNDVTETFALKRLFGEQARRVPVSSCKGQIGHTISAAGVCNLIFATKAMQEGYVPPTVHYGKQDPVCNLDYVPNEPRSMKIRAALVNAFAFGGQNAALAIRAV